MAKNTTLTEALSRAVGSPQPAPVLGADTGRANKKLVSGHFCVETSDQLKLMAVRERTTLQKLLQEALNDLFVKRGLPPIA